MSYDKILGYDKTTDVYTDGPFEHDKIIITSSHRIFRKSIRHNLDYQGIARRTSFNISYVMNGADPKCKLEEIIPNS